LRDPKVAIQPKEPQYHTKASDFLLKVFGKEQGMQHHHWQRQLWKHHLYRFGGLFKVRNGATPSPLHHWMDKEGSMHKDNESLSSPYFNWQILSKFSYLQCWYGCMSHTIGSTMTARRRCYPPRQEEHIHVHLQEQEDCHETNTSTTNTD